ncbi:MAG: hypothetical protein HYW47_02100 [Deltaproteobacteria bacterium]|nr:hypothetical protein [Deltaproteobacteria bacterium]
MLGIIRNQKGLTLLEIIIATGIFLGATTMMVRIQKNGIQQMKEARHEIIAKTLLQQKMEEILLEYDQKSFNDIDFKNTEAGDFGEEHEGFKWRSETLPYHFSIHKAFALLKSTDESLEENPAFSFLEPHLDKIEEYISDSSREVTVTITWGEGTQEKNLSATTHIVKYDKSLNIMGVGL